jgi:two-component system sensor histidine kinase KdpD
MSDARVDPDELLRHVVEEERRARRGKLVIFFGAAPGVGKTYAMLEAARSERDLKRDVVVGIVETHGRFDTGALVIGLELLPRRKVGHRGITIEEFDLDAALARKPGLILVDELAHTNAPDSRHEKRWQDVEDLLDAGIDVYSTVNVQHIESLNDVVAQVTGVVVRETVPDRILEEATEVRLIDLPPDELLERLEEGKVYVPERAERAVQNFFRKGNLIALRELALRRTAERVDAQMRNYRTANGIQSVWPTGERVLVCVSPSPYSARLVRSACRMSSSLRAPWIASYVETPAALRMSDASRQRLAENLRLAERLGAEVVTLKGDSAAEETVGYARRRNVTKIVVGKPTHSRYRDLFRTSFLEEIVRSSGDIDVHVISGEEEAPTSSSAAPSSERKTGGRPFPFIASTAMVVVATVASWLLFGRRQLADAVMVYLLGIVLVSMRFGYVPSVLSTVLSVMMLDFFFVSPSFSFSVSDFQHAVMFAVMFVVAIVVSNLTQRVRKQADAARYREQRTATLYSMSRELAATRAVRNLAAVALAHVKQVFEARVALMLDRGHGYLEDFAAGDSTFTLEQKDKDVLDWVWSHGKPAGLGTDTLPAARARYLPLQGARGAIGVLGVLPSDPQRFGDTEQRALLDVFGSQIASALERARVAEQAQQAHLQTETDKLRSSLLSAVSRDLRVPLTVIKGAASALVQSGSTLGAAARHDLAEAIEEEADRLNRLVRNLQDMTRLTTGEPQITKEWQPIEGIVGAAVERLERELHGKNVVTRLPPEGALVPIDGLLVEQLLVHLLENSARYAPAGTAIEISAHQAEGDLVLEVADRGPGISDDSTEQVFEKFYRLPRERNGGGAGLGLAISRAIVEAHGGRIWAQNRDGGGASFRFTLPLAGPPPAPLADDSTGVFAAAAVH